MERERRLDKYNRLNVDIRSVCGSAVQAAEHWSATGPGRLWLFRLSLKVTRWVMFFQGNTVLKMPRLHQLLDLSCDRHLKC